MKALYFFLFILDKGHNKWFMIKIAEYVLKIRGQVLQIYTNNGRKICKSKMILFEVLFAILFKEAAW